MSWEKEVEEIQNRKRLALQMGGKDSVERHHRSGKLTARERIDVLLDKDSFKEHGALTAHTAYETDGRLKDYTPANSIIGSGYLEGRRVVVTAEDYTVRAGSSEASLADKWIWAETLALEMRQPLIRLVDTAGGSVKILASMGSTKLPGYPSWRAMELMSHVPVVGVALGSVAGLGAFRVVASHFSVMVKGSSQIFAAGPHVVKPATGEDLNKEELGGYQVHTRGSGVVHNEAETEGDAFDQVKTFLSYLPSNVFLMPPRCESTDDPGRREEELLSIIPRNSRRVYDARRILELLFDQGSIFEMGRCFGPSVITVFARLNGFPVGVMANDPRIFGGGLTRSAAEKTERFIDLCNMFHLPMVNLMDQPGVVVGLDAELSGVLRYASRTLLSIEQSRIPWIAVILRRAFGLAGSGYGRQSSLNLRYAWPSARWGSIPIEGGVMAAHRREIETAEKPEEYIKELERFYENLQSPFRTAEHFGITDIIDPRATRPLLCDWVEQAYKILPETLGLSYFQYRC
jgi:acetyl-CoA carboxylase carboxyltransferase component